MNNENTLFLITAEGERHEDHIPEYIWPLGKIKNYVTAEVYEQLCSATDWVTDVNWFCMDDVMEEDRQELEDIRSGKNTDQDAFDNCVGEVIRWPMKLHPIILDENNCLSFSQT